MKMTLKNLEAVQKLALKVAANLPKKKAKNAQLLLLQGDLGSGKTTFTQALASAFGIRARLTSPTFVIQKKYPIKKHPRFRHFIHVDCYRLRGGADLLKLGWGEMLADPENLVVVEWPELIKEILPRQKQVIKFKFIDDQTRVVEL